MSKLINEGLRDWYADVDWKALRREDLGSGTLVEGNGNFDRIKTVFNIFLDIKPNQLSTDLVQRLDAKLEEFKILVNEIYSYSDIRQRKNVLTLISGFEYRFVNELGNHIAYYTNLFKEQNEQKVDTAELKKHLRANS